MLPVLFFLVLANFASPALAIRESDIERESSSFADSGHVVQGHQINNQDSGSVSGRFTPHVLQGLHTALGYFHKVVILRDKIYAANGHIPFDQSNWKFILHQFKRYTITGGSQCPMFLNELEAYEQVNTSGPSTFDFDALTRTYQNLMTCWARDDIGGARNVKLGRSQLPTFTCSAGNRYIGIRIAVFDSAFSDSSRPNGAWKEGKILQFREKEEECEWNVMFDPVPYVQQERFGFKSPEQKWMDLTKNPKPSQWFITGHLEKFQCARDLLYSFYRSPKNAMPFEEELSRKPEVKSRLEELLTKIATLSKTYGHEKIDLVASGDATWGNGIKDYAIDGYIPWLQENCVNTNEDEKWFCMCGEGNYLADQHTDFDSSAHLKADVTVELKLPNDRLPTMVAVVQQLESKAFEFAAKMWNDECNGTTDKLVYLCSENPAPQEKRDAAMDSIMSEKFEFGKCDHCYRHNKSGVATESGGCETYPPNKCIDAKSKMSCSRIAGRWEAPGCNQQ